jgi:hypothetical protein
MYHKQVSFHRKILRVFQFLKFYLYLNRSYATSRNVAGSNPDGVISIFFFNLSNPSSRSVTLGLTQSLTEMSTRRSFWESKSKLYYDRESVGQSVLGSGNPPGTSDQFFPFYLWLFVLTVSGLLMWGALSDEKSGLHFSVFAGYRQRSLSQICVPRDSFSESKERPALKDRHPNSHLWADCLDNVRSWTSHDPIGLHGLLRG